MKTLFLSLLLMATALCGVWLFRSLRPSPDVRYPTTLLEHERILLKGLEAPLDTPSRSTAVKRGRGGRLLYFYDGEWRTTPPPPQDLPLRVRPVEQRAFPYFR